MGKFDSLSLGEPEHGKFGYRNSLSQETCE